MPKHLLFPGLPMTFRLFEAPGEGAPAAGDPPPPAGDTPPAPAATSTAPPGPRWWEAKDYTPEEQQWLTAKGLTEDDPTKIIPKLVKGHRSAEQRLGKGIDSIIDKPAKDQKLPDWMRANAANLGLPDKEDGYSVQAPDFWPKEAKWDADLEAAARKVAFENGVPTEAHKAYVDLFAGKMKAMIDGAEGELTRARETMMADLKRDYGDQTNAVITQAKQAAQYFAEQAGLDTKAVEHIGQLLGEAAGDASTIRFFAAISKAMGEDSAVHIGKGGQLTMTPAEARAELAQMNSADGPYGKAFATNDRAALEALRPRREQLAKLASQR